MINVNKLFPRLSIRVKLVIAFALIALVPLATVSVIGARKTIAQMEKTARITLEHDLQMAEEHTSQSLASAETHVTYFAEFFLAPLVDAGSSSGAARAETERVMAALLATEPALYQVKLIDADGAYRLIARPSGLVPLPADGEGGQYYAWRASSMRPHTRLIFAIELPGEQEEGGARRPMPAVAIVVPVYAASGEMRGVVVGEAHASVLFARLDAASPGFDGVTGLVDEDGRFLYHSLRKRDWATLLAARDRVNLRSDFSRDVAAAILSGRQGAMVTPQQELVSYRPLSLGTSSSTRLSIYRVIPRALIAAPMRAFLASVFLAAVLVALIVLGLAVIAAGQFTKPIFRIRDAAWQLARGEAVQVLDVDTNDEFEDLAHDFGLVAQQVATHRAQREVLIAERTHALEQTHAELTDVLEHSADGIIGLDPEGLIRIWNRGAQHLFGFAGGETAGRHINDVLRPSGERAERERRALLAEMRREGAVVNFLTEVLAKDGDPIQITLTQTLIAGSDGRPLGSSLIVRDNRLQARLEDQMRRSERLAAISVMAAGLAHEINNPLAIIGNRIECMQRDIRDKWKDTSLASDVDVLHEHVVRLAELTSSLLRFARDDDLEAAPVAMDTLAENTVALLRRTFATRRVGMELIIERPVPVVVGYEKAIETVVVNLLLNAADATPPEGEVTLAVRPSPGRPGIEIEVRDTGPGIPLALRERVFEPFFTTKDPGHGTGLGLTVCRSIVDRHGGSIRVYSGPCTGCRILVSLPLQPVVSA